MYNSQTDQISASEFAKLLADAFINAALQRERGDETYLFLAREARTYPSEVVDEAFSIAMEQTLIKLKPAPLDLAELLIIAEQFVDRAGANKFLSRARIILNNELLNRRDKQNEFWSDAEYANIRARYLSLAHAIGVAISLETLQNESELKKFEPLLWMDIAVRELSSSAFVEVVEEFISLDTFHPFSLLPRLKSIVQIHGTGVAQAVLNAACRKLYAHKRFDEAEQFIQRANIISPKGWRLPLGGTPISISMPVATASDCVGALIGALKIEMDQPIRIVQAFRYMLDPVLSPSEDDQEEQKRHNLRQRLFSEISNARSFDKILLTGLLPSLRNEDFHGIDWWQDFGPWRSRLPSRAAFVSRASAKSTVEAIASLKINTETKHDANDAIVASHPSSGFSAIDALNRIGFGSQVAE